MDQPLRGRKHGCLGKPCQIGIVMSVEPQPCARGLPLQAMFRNVLRDAPVENPVRSTSSSHVEIQDLTVCRPWGQTPRFWLSSVAPTQFHPGNCSHSALRGKSVPAFRYYREAISPARRVESLFIPLERSQCRPLRLPFISLSPFSFSCLCLGSYLMTPPATPSAGIWSSPTQICLKWMLG